MMQRSLSSPELTLGRKLIGLNWLMVVLISCVACVGFVMLYSAAGGSFQPWSERQIIRYGIGCIVMIAVALVDIRIWLRYAYVLYFLALALLVVVDVAGHIGMGAQRWIRLGL
ncbi:MAG: FtsW/RodA/SpoVE family cell cycle protein, partial [Proteobacteria bacterium]|nr:FtsW/RodA/SpoVE family cell cycle protein [Pseudomonadota bacterium]